MQQRTLFTNVHGFDGGSEKGIENTNVLLRGNLIKTLSAEAIKAVDTTMIIGGPHADAGTDRCPCPLMYLTTDTKVINEAP